MDVGHHQARRHRNSIVPEAKKRVAASSISVSGPCSWVRAVNLDAHIDGEERGLHLTSTQAALIINTARA